jgi:uncharacterized protein
MSHDFDEPDGNMLDEEDLLELDGLLRKLENADALTLDGAQGLLCALAVSPKPLDPEIWLPAILGENPVMPDADSAQELVRGLIRFAQSIDTALEYHALDPILAEVHDESGNSEIDVGGWCQGFSMGIDLQSDAWEQQMQADPQLIEILSPIVALGVDDGVFAEVLDPEIAPLGDAEREELIRELPNLLSDVRDYWRSLASDLATSAQLRHAKQLH